MLQRRRTLASLAAFVLAAIALTGCGSDTTSSTSAYVAPSVHGTSGSGGHAIPPSTSSTGSSGSTGQSPSPAVPASSTFGSATLSWMPPATNTDGSALTNLAGYYIHFGTDKAALDHSIRIDAVDLTTYVISNLAPATYYFMVTSFTESGTESPPSSIISKII